MFEQADREIPSVWEALTSPLPWPARSRRLRLWAALLIAWGSLVRDEGLQLFGIRYRLIADLEGGRAT